MKKKNRLTRRTLLKASAALALPRRGPESRRQRWTCGLFDGGVNYKQTSRCGDAIMWDDTKRQRFEHLRQHQAQLDASEQAELARLVAELEVGESSYLNGATERMRHERIITEKQNPALEQLAVRKKALIQRLTTTLADARAERRAIESELASVLTGGPAPETHE
jgi:hypothetical protein